MGKKPQTRVNHISNGLGRSTENRYEQHKPIFQDNHIVTIRILIFSGNAQIFTDIERDPTSAREGPSIGRELRVHLVHLMCARGEPFAGSWVEDHPTSP